MSAFAQTDRTRVRRLPARASYDVETVHAILDAGLVCHVGFVEGDRPIVIPTAYARIGDAVVFHGASKSRTLLAAVGGAELCISVALIDGLVLARSAFHHSINYRSVVLFGRATEIAEPERKLAALEAFMERLYPGRWAAVRTPNEQELKATVVLELPLREAVAKVRTGGPIDDEEDMTWPVWAGVVPLALAPGAPEPAPDLAFSLTAPVTGWPQP